MPYFHAGTCWDLIETSNTAAGGENQLASASAVPWCLNETQALEVSACNYGAYVVCMYVCANPFMLTTLPALSMLLGI
jgi:hypothetical protein